MKTEVVAQICNLSTREAEAGGPEVEGHLGHLESLFTKTK